MVSLEIDMQRQNKKVALLAGLLDLVVARSLNQGQEKV